MLLYTSFYKTCFSFCLGLSNSQFSYIGCTFKALLFFCMQILDIFYGIYPTTYLLHNSQLVWLSVISLRLDFQRYRAENVFVRLISTGLDRLGYQPTTCLIPTICFLLWSLKCSLPFKPIKSVAILEFF